MTDFKDREPALLRLSKGAMREWYGLILGWLLVMAAGGCLLWNVARARGLLPRGDSMMLWGGGRDRRFECVGCCTLVLPTQSFTGAVSPASPP